MVKKDLVKEQFDKQAKQFSSWIWTKSELALQSLFNFIGFSERDRLLDVACGSGNFAVFCAQRISRVHGIDISPGMIEIARNLAKESDLDNLSFSCHDVANLSFEANSYTVVTSRGAFHHMANFEIVFKEMARCCEDNGLICLDDITDYGNPHVSAFFDEFDRAIDPSHYTRVASKSIRSLFSSNGIKMLKEEQEEFEMDVAMYASHAIQTKDATKKINQLIEDSLRDPLVSKFLYKKDDNIVFKNRGYRILGRKQPVA